MTRMTLARAALAGSAVAALVAVCAAAVAIGLFAVFLALPAHAQTVPAAQASLDTMDSRQALPLLPMMAEHQKENMRSYLVAVQAIVAALATDDFAGIQKQAASFGYSEHTRQMCENMGAAAPEFTHQALAFHKSVDLIAQAARDHDKPRVIATLGQTLQRCTSCHAAWKQQLIGERHWMRLTATPAMRSH